MQLNLETIRAHCLEKGGRVKEEFPFDEVHTCV